MCVRLCACVCVCARARAVCVMKRLPGRPGIEAVLAAASGV